MKSNDPQIDPLELQRLVDGELDHEQTRQMLLKAQSTPEQWQQIAVGFVENQSFQRTIESSFLGKEILGLGVSGVSSEQPSEVHLKQVAEAQPNDVASVTDPQAVFARPNSRQKPNSKWVLAASLLAAATIGYMFSHIQNRNIPSNSIVENNSPVSPDSPESDLAIAKNSNGQPDPSQITPTSLSPDYHVELPGDQFAGFESGETQSSVPIFRVGNEVQLRQFHQQRQDASRIPDEILIRLSNSRFQMQQEIEIISGSVGDGEEFVIPVRTIRFVPFQ